MIVVEHDLSVLDYLSDFICCLYGKPGAYGVVTLPFSVREGINIFLAGFVPTENLRFREESLTFKVTASRSQIFARSGFFWVKVYEKHLHFRPFRNRTPSYFLIGESSAVSSILSFLCQLNGAFC